MLNIIGIVKCKKVGADICLGIPRYVYEYE